MVRHYILQLLQADTIYCQCLSKEQHIFYHSHAAQSLTNNRSETDGSASVIIEDEDLSVTTNVTTRCNNITLAPARATLVN